MKCITQSTELKVEMVALHEKRVRKCLSKVKGTYVLHSTPTPKSKAGLALIIPSIHTDQTDMISPLIHQVPTS